MKRILFSLIALTVLLSACGLQVVAGSGSVITETRPVNDYTQVVFALPGELIISQDGSESVSLVADDNLLPYLTTTVTNGVLRISTGSNALLLPSRPIRVLLSVKSLEVLSLFGSGKIYAETLVSDGFMLNVLGSGDIVLDELNAQQGVVANLSGSGSLKAAQLSAASLTMTLNGSGDANFASLQTDALTATLNGSGSCTAAGSAAVQKIRITGSGDFHAFELEGANTEVGIWGSGSGQLWVTETLVIKIAGSGDISYKGSPALTQTITGSGTIGSRP